MIGLILDRRTRFLPPSPRCASLLTMPVGERTVLGHLASRIDGFAQRDLVVVPTFDFDSDYEKEIQADSTIQVRVAAPDALDCVLNAADPSDYIVIIDPSRWPVNGFDLADEIRDHVNYRAASHLVAIGADHERAREHVECDGNGGVKRVRRLFDRANWPEVAATEIFLSVVPVWSVADVTFSSLSDLREALSANGVLSRDLPAAVDLVDLTDERGLLALNERTLYHSFKGNGLNGFSLRADQVLIGRNCTIHPSARLVGPIVIHDDVQIDRNVSIVGPSVLGPRSRVRQGATVAGSVLASGTHVAPHAAILHRVASGRNPVSDDNSDPQAPLVVESLRVSGFNHHAHWDPQTASRAEDWRRTIRVAIKRALDILLASAGLILLLPLLLVVAILIKLDSPGPLFFSHRRERHGGKEFSCLKFRTMVVDADRLQKELCEQNEVDGPQFKMNDDPRVTRLGRLMRATNIDELPQLLNVLWGHMSLVGPRPSPFRENQICVPWRRARLSVAPGITGLWQICRDDRSGGDFHQWIFYDMAYVRNFSIWLDLKIIIATAVTLGGKWHVPYGWLVPSEQDNSAFDADVIPVDSAVFT